MALLRRHGSGTRLGRGGSSEIAADRSPRLTAVVVLGVCCVQDTPARWVSVHRLHHQHSDEPTDPHSPLGSFVWGHMSWLMVQAPELARMRIYERYAKDILADRFYRALERNWRWVYVVLASWGVFFAAGFIGASVAGRTTPEALRMGDSFLVWGVFLRTVLVWHITWSVELPGACLGFPTLRYQLLQPEQSICRLRQQW